ncbi:motile sperm domain-containing protein 1-like [Ruditapes philippinarum]|uniref:motile sperm domain-containing protein 1-like n=1 Tax=Ruditapes philippinarum TaxID=129788 RepID=UPI00295A7D08|nr:motile sperm domain-containing protein 1-like [Ruditapes philippinarum]XP_060593283.1 motile sperm domain-containing protein 1-like [Ruditapes philippinarum]
MFNQSTNLADGKLPVFVFPTTLSFYSDDQSSHKQVLTLYNPYEFPLKFKVLCTVPRKYTVVDAEGTVRPRCCVDVVVRHTDICINNEGVNDKFRIQVSEHGQRKILGKKDVNAVLLPTKGREVTPNREDKFHALAHSSQGPDIQGQSYTDSDVRKRPVGGPSIVVILAGLVCIVALMLPQQGDSGSRLPDYIHLSVNQKLIAAYVLGLVTMLILHI